MKKKELIWKFDCYFCKVSICIDTETVTSTDQSAVFIMKPTYYCGKCGDECSVKLVRK